MMKLYQIAEEIGVDKGNLSKTFSGKRKVSWSLALKLSKMFPEKGVEAWKDATPEEIKTALRKNNTNAQSQFQTKKNEAAIGEIDEN